jgi:ABC-type multidrug transport system fused ATPase/permease subunit
MKLLHNLIRLTEQEIEDSLWQFMHGKTALVISNRLSTLQLMDRILVIENGKIVEDGTHEQLIFKDGLYNTLWNTQVCGMFDAL